MEAETQEEEKELTYKDYVKAYVVDDSDMSRSSIIKILEKEGYKVVGSAGSADECIANIKGDINVFIIDVVMPEKSGIDLTKLLFEHLRDIHVIMLSSLRQEHILMESIATGARDFINKPFDPTELLAAVEKIAMQLDEEARKN